jgi:virulence factor Mce-like protein
VKRAGLVALLGAAIVAAFTVGAGDSGTPDGRYRVDAIFDSAAFLTPGSEVKIAGAEVGAVKEVKLTDDLKARVVMEVDDSFAPFRADADCMIQPQSLIGERFIQCTPGTPKAKVLTARGDDPAPTLPVANTHTPVDLDLVLSGLRTPTPQRLALIVNELGTGLAGRPEELNEALRRSHPALGEANRVLEILHRDRDRIGKLVDESDRLLAVVTERKEDVGRFIDSASTVTETTAEREADLRATLRGLPELARELRPSFDRLDELATDGEPILRELERTAPDAERLLGEVLPFSASARPALAALGDVTTRGRTTVTATMPVATRLQTLADGLVPATKLAEELTESLRDSGTVEGLLRFIYYGVAATARFDSVSHILPALPVVTLCSLPLQVRNPECAAQFKSFTDSPSSASRKRSKRDRERDKRDARRDRGDDRRDPRDTNSEPGTDTRDPAATATTPASPSPVSPSVPDPVPAPAPAPDAPAPGSAPAPGQPSSPLEELLDYLLG